MALRLLLLVLAARSVAAATAPPPSLTTAFVPSPLCTIDIYNVADATAACVAGTAAVVCQYFQLGVTAPTSDCFPSGFDPSSTAFFSPGLACPSGYATACSSVASLASGGRETRATCCPSSYSCQTATDFPWFTTDLCVYAVPGTVTFVYTSSALGVGYVTSTATGGGQAAINAYGVQIRFQSTDLVAATSSRVITSGTRANNPLPSTAASDTALAGASPTGAGASDGLSTGAKAGIGVGVVVAVLLGAAGSAVFFWRRRRRRVDYEAPPGYMPRAPPGGAELEGPSQMQTKHELAAPNTYAELPVSGPALLHHEMPNRTIHGELEG